MKTVSSALKPGSSGGDVDFQLFLPLAAAVLCAVISLGFLVGQNGLGANDVTPGAALLMLLCAASLGAIAILSYGRGRRVAQGLIESQAQAMHLALHDSLTGLPNRALLNDRLAQALEQMRRGGPQVSVIALDLDRFKEVNDTFGHPFGDELLVEVARRLKEVCRASDTVCRQGGDEFTIIAVDAGAAQAAALANRVIAKLSAPVDLPVGQVHVGVSLGISVLQSQDSTAIEALRQADMALYRAKNAGRGQFAFFEPEMDAAQRLRREIEQDLRAALAEGALEMFYQCQVGGGGEVQGVEALLRWRHPVRGAIAPEYFVRLAEECGLIEPLSFFTISKAIEDSVRWPDAVKVAINLSPVVLRMRAFLPGLEALFAQTGADPARFEFEITESVFLGADRAVQESLLKLREMGFSLALDDFGTGYSSLNYLKSYPVDRIKIDRSFVASLGQDRQTDAIVGAIVNLGHALDLSVIAEGVETSDQRDRLRTAGCSDVQGYLFNHPMAAGDLQLALQTGALPAEPPPA